MSGARSAGVPEQRRDPWLTSLLESSRAVATASRLEEALSIVAHRTAEALGSPGCIIYEYDPSCDAIIPRALYEARPTGWNKIGVPLPLSEHATERRLLETGELLEECLSQPDLDPVSRASLKERGDVACLNVPLRVHDESKGMLVVFESEHERRFSREELAFASGLGEMAAAAIHNAQLVRHLEERNRRLDSLLDTTRALTSSTVGDEFLTTLARKAGEALGCPGCIIWEYDEADGSLVAQAMYERQLGTEQVGVRPPLQDWPGDLSILDGDAMVVEALSDPNLGARTRATMEAVGQKTCLSLPLRCGDEALGILVLVETEQERAFSEAELELARRLSEHAAVAMHSARLFRRLEAQSYETKLLNDIARRTAASLNLRDIAASTVDELRRLTRFDHATLFTLTDGVPEVVFTTDDSGPLTGSPMACVSPQWIGRLERAKVVLLDTGSHGRPLSADDPCLDGICSAAAIALFEEGRLVGALTLGSDRAAAFSEADRRVFEGVGAHLSLAVKNARLHENIKKLHVGGLRALSSALNAKDYYTLGHTARVATYAALLAAELGWPQELVDRVEEVAHLHDIGKVSVADHILLKPSKLSEEDWRLMREHPAVSADILQPLLEERLVAGVRHHHESYDGTGYPDGLTGQSIPELARLLCVADSYDAMSSRRLHREPFSYPECVDELRRCRGTQFDPRMTDAFLRVLQRLAAVKQTVMAAAAEAADLIGAGKHSLLRQRGDEALSEYAEIAGTLRRVRGRYPSISSMSTEVRLDEHRVMLVVDAQENPELRLPIGETSLSDEERVEAFSGRMLDSNVVFVNGRGAWISGIAPLRDAEGRVVALVSADVPALALQGSQGDAGRAFSDLMQNAASRLTGIEIDAKTDFLSGLYNHRYFQDRLREEVHSALDSGGEMSLLFCDVDVFKEYNDRFGHTAGDAALRAVAHVIGGSIRAADVAARYGGDEFAVILVGAGSSLARGVAERIRAGVTEIQPSGGEGRLTVSIGVATLPHDGHTKEQLVERADWAMYLAKRRGRDQVAGSSAGEGETVAAPVPSPAARRLLTHIADACEARSDEAGLRSEAVSELASAVVADLGLSEADSDGVEDMVASLVRVLQTLPPGVR
jgi:diguanylate cyclase (GGDEF)-like protein